MHNLYDVFPTKEVPRGGEDKVISHLEGQKSPKLQFREHQYAFSSQTRTILKPPYYRNYRTDCNQIMYSDKDRRVLFGVVRTRVQQISDGERPPFWRNR